MDKSSLAPISTLYTRSENFMGNATDKKSSGQSKNARNVFVSMALTMSWQLAIVVLVPVFAGVKMDKAFNSGNSWLFVGLGLALVGSAAVMWHAMQVANHLPVPKLTEEERRKIRKEYEDEDKNE